MSKKLRYTHFKAVKTRPPWLTKNKTYKILSTSEGDTFSFKSDYDGVVGVGNTPSWITPYVANNVIGGKLI